MANIKLIQAPDPLLSPSELALHLKLDTATQAADGSLIANSLAAAHRYAEHYTGCSLGPQVLELALDAFPDGAIELPRGPVTGVVSVTYVNTSGVVSTLSSGGYVLDDYSVPAWLLAAYGSTWPTTLDVANAVKVRYNAGAANIDPAVRAALLLIVGHLYANREDVAPGSLARVPLGADALLDTIKVWKV